VEWEAAATALLGATLVGYATGAVTGLALGRWAARARVLGFSLAAVSAAAGCAAGTVVLTTGVRPQMVLGAGPVPLLEFSITLDPLAALFLLLVSLIGLAVSIYSIGYAREHERHGTAGLLVALYNLMLLATSLVVGADNAFFFLIAWESMALVSYGLVAFEHEEAEARRAGILYFVMSHAGTACLVLGFLLLFAASGSHRFADYAGTALTPAARQAAFVLFAIGFGVKAGVIPLHIWLPLAHPVAPSNVSAFLSAILIKMGIYGLVRVLFGPLGAPDVWWGVLVLAAGGVSAVLGVLYALVEHDLKRLLAYHSIENVGIILVGLGASLVFAASGYPPLAAMALAAALYHTVNHATFKGLLFLGAGAVVQATGSRDMEQLGGLVRRMPWTAASFLVGAVAISALPPLNGFVSEWLTYQALLHGFDTTRGLLRLLFPFGGVLLALAGALAAACFVKAVGITFLAQPRSEAAGRAGEAPVPMLAGMGLLVAACALLGLFPGFMLGLLDPVTTQLLGEPVAGRLLGSDGLVLTTLEPRGGTVSTLGLAMMIVGLLPVVVLLARRAARRGAVSVGPTWDCGLPRLTPSMEYTATAFSKPFRMIFRAIYRPTREVQADFTFSRYFTRVVHFETRIDPTFERLIYEPFNRAVLQVARRSRVLQPGSVHLYLLYIFVTLLLLLGYAR
jgi:hydrogenase-4 component B